MEPHSRTEDSPESRAILEGQLRECYGRVVYSHKTHEKCADILLDRLGQLKVTQIVLSAITTAGFVSAIVGAGSYAAAVGALVSTTLLVLNAYMKSYDMGTLAQKHREAASDLWLIRERYLSLLVDLRMKERPLEAIQESRDQLLRELHAVYRGAPSTTFKAYRKAQQALQRMEDMTFTDAEIDAFLPGELKRSQ